MSEERPERPGAEDRPERPGAEDRPERPGAGELSAEDAKLLTLARSARSRVGGAEGAAVRDGDGRSYTGVSVVQPSFEISALQLAVANALAAGASTLEAAAVVTSESKVDEAPVTDLTPGAPVLLQAP